MNDSAFKDMLPSDFERRQIFFQLKKTSSNTACRRVLDYYRAWASVTEAGLGEARELGWADKTGSIMQQNQMLPSYRRSHTFHFRPAKEDFWYQPPLLDDECLPEVESNSAFGGKAPSEDGVVSARTGGLYFISDAIGDGCD